MENDILMDMLCCAGDTDHTIREGGGHINLVLTKKLAKWPYMTAINFLVSEPSNHPLAVAVVCNRCLKEKREIKYVIGGRDGSNGSAEYFRVPIEQLEDPEFYWPDHHPDRLDTDGVPLDLEERADQMERQIDERTERQTLGRE
ncbi:MAG: hypothetical protein PHU23_15955 [Dehalococcoidales bacterium]|nr:hypothetical protein [Dehalococcoidales bacterium]